MICFKFLHNIIEELKNTKAAADFLKHNYQKANSLDTFPFGYREISFEYRGYEIRLKHYDSHNIFFVVEAADARVIILRVLKDRQDWETLLSKERESHFK